ncbi:phosphate acetyltransferase [Micromonospora zamorensis]|uniref:Phosphate acetyltransferase n=1 Tax=Micromonospora zamorensis TaxID=709883 RepID=A0ABZ1PEQ0_9ACTN|nr:MULTISPECIES: phosphate acetyltransferase [Micromonospora]MBQ0978857.1 phosphate acetyltransferase [Micromonospora sp. M61]MBQ1039673.1 phosphate acetyltransferase [Micromonospora sp. C81]WSK50926.1 phosphate acetyltransferase [Micromonospora zamorensis]WTE86519.1 phosphate acetyltransferase [Micromonospora zamorensis]SCG63094.1 phosphate acetyltransferase [Micromonospora zamorensis]
MARSVYLTSVGSGGGKSTIALGLAELLSRQVGRIGVFRPLVSGTGPDPILALLHDRYRVDLPEADLTGMTYAEAAALVADGRREELISRVVERYRAVERQCPAVVVVGSDFDDPGDPAHPRELAFNARLATEFGSVVVPVVDGFEQEPAAVAAAMRGAYHDLADLGATVLAVMANRVAGPMTLPDLPVPAYAIPEVPTVSAPTVAEVAAALDATLLAGDDAALSRDVLDFVVGAAHVPTLLDHLTEGALVITPGDRADLLVAASAAHVAGQVSVAGLVLTLGEQPDPRAMRLVEGLNTGLAVLSVRSDSYDTVAASSRIEGRPSAANPRKVEAALGAFERCVDTDDLARRLRVSRSTRVTPLMFENELIDRARSQRRHLVLPEGADDRILRAAEILLRRGVAELTLLGRPDDITRRTRELGIDLGDANVVDPVTSDWRDDFAAEYARLRAHRGMTAELAHDIVAQPNYFGTLMVATGRADGMVSGATHTTAATIRPAFEIIRTVPEVSVASSVFFMLLADRVLVYGDCAVNRDPDAAQLADIAISSADTAARFGIEPRVAMLSYSTGSSGAGADVEKVAAATALVRERRPDLLVEGPIQYDAAIDPAVAATKLPGSPVAGHATVFIFPDLNTGNNTYKAVQRSAGAVAVGPVMQGLRRPVNDLSRGAMVPDIVNTVAITAIQAATEEAS